MWHLSTTISPSITVVFGVISRAQDVPLFFFWQFTDVNKHPNKNSWVMSQNDFMTIKSPMSRTRSCTIKRTSSCNCPVMVSQSVEVWRNVLFKSDRNLPEDSESLKGDRLLLQMWQYYVLQDKSVHPNCVSIRCMMNSNTTFRHNVTSNLVLGIFWKVLSIETKIADSRIELAHFMY